MTTTMGHAAATTAPRSGVLAWVRAAPAPLRWGMLVTLGWAIALPFLNLLSGMVRTQPPGGESNYWTGMLVAVALYVVAAALAGWFAIRGSRIAQITLVSTHVLLGGLAIVNLSEYLSTGIGVLAPANVPLGAPMHASIVWGITIAVSLVGMALLCWPSVWRHTAGRGLLPQSHVSG